MKYSFKEHLDDMVSWLQNNELYNADTLSWCLQVAYDRWKNKDVLFSQEVENEEVK